MTGKIVDVAQSESQRDARFYEPESSWALGDGDSGGLAVRGAARKNRVYAFCEVRDRVGRE